MVTEQRASAVVGELVATLREFIRRHRVTDAQYRQAVAFLASTVDAGELEFMADVLFESVVDDVAEASVGATDSNVRGPFYIQGAPLLESGDDSQQPAALPMRSDEPGDLMTFRGTVRSTNGAALRQVVVDVWQADCQGLYSRFAPELPEWNLRGRLRADDEGRFAFRTVVPAAYDIPSLPYTTRVLDCMGVAPHRPAHVHLTLEAAQHDTLTTQVYFAGDPWLSHDAVGAAKPTLATELRKLTMSGQTGYECRFDFVLAPTAKVPEGGPPSRTRATEQSLRSR